MRRPSPTGDFRAKKKEINEHDIIPEGTVHISCQTPMSEALRIMLKKTVPCKMQGYWLSAKQLLYSQESVF
jgi:hypothetical protein